MATISQDGLVAERVKEPDQPAAPSREDATAAFHYKPGQSLGYLIRDCYRIFARRLDSLISPHGVKMGQWYFLRELWERDGLASRPGESHPQALPEPCVNLSTHTAPDVRPLP